MFKLGVIGHPIAHSKSPTIHAAFAKQCGLTISYEKFDVEPNDFDNFVAHFFEQGGNGLNITVPFKEAAFKLTTLCHDRASLSKAVNTLQIDNKKRLIGNNTDGPGLINDLKQNHGTALENKRLLILGAGGAVRGILPSLIEERPAEILLLNRTLQKADAIKLEMKNLFKITTGDYSISSLEKYDCIINGTSLGLNGQVPPLDLGAIGSGTICYDLMYGDSKTAFVRWGEANGASKSLDGLGMLVEQAAESFEIWTGTRPDTPAVISMMRG